MKRYIALILVIATIFSMTACSVSTDAIADEVEDQFSEAVDDAVDDAKTQASEWVAEEIENAKNEVSGFFGGLAEDVTSLFPFGGKEDSTDGETDGSEPPPTEGRKVDDTQVVITYNPNGGINGPTEQYCKKGAYPKITNEKPSREGYHFVGWTRLEGSTEPQFFAGTKAWCNFTQDTTLYACWEAYDASSPFTVSANKVETLNFLGIAEEIFGISAGVKTITIEHNYHLDKVEGKIIRIFCDCGFELIDRDISLDNFVFIKSNRSKTSYDSLKESKQADYYKDWVLYRTQDFAPMALNLIGSFYESFNTEVQTFDPNAPESTLSTEDNFDLLLASFSEFGKQLEFAANFDLAYANSVYGQEFVDLKWTHYDDYDGYKIAYLLREMKPDDTNALIRESKTEFFTQAANLGKATHLAFGFARAIYYGYDAFASDEMVTSKTISMVKAVHTLVTLCPYVGTYYNQLLTTLEEGLELCDKCFKKMDSYHALLTEILENSRTGKEDSWCIGNTSLTLLHIDQAKNNIFAENDPEFMDAPTVMKLLGELLSYPDGTEMNNYSLLGKNQKTLVVWYLAMRLEYDFQNEYGITLEDYMEYVK